MTTPHCPDAYQSPADNGTAPVWVISDGRAGIENQALGLAERVQDEFGFSFAVKRIAPRGWQKLLPVKYWPAPLNSVDADALGFTGPMPSLMIGCGRMAIPFLLWARRQGVRTIYLQDPRIATAHFDLVIAPQHDLLVGANVVSPLGSVHRITPDTLAQAAADWAERLSPYPAPRVAVLIGGNNKYHRLDPHFAAKLADRLGTLAARSNASLMVTLSRRTPDGARKVLEDKLNSLPHCYVWDGKGDNPYFALLGSADYIAVTGETVNMASEAALTGKPLYRIDLPQKRRLGGLLPAKRTTKFQRFHAALEASGASRVLTDRLEVWDYEPLDWADSVMAAVEPLITNA